MIVWEFLWNYHEFPLKFMRCPCLTINAHLEGMLYTALDPTKLDHLHETFELVINYLMY